MALLNKKGRHSLDDVLQVVYDQEAARHFVDSGTARKSVRDPQARRDSEVVDRNRFLDKNRID